MNENENIILIIREINTTINNISTYPLNKNEILSVSSPSIEKPTLFQPRMIIRIPMKMMMTRINNNINNKN